MKNETRKEKSKIFLAISYTERGKVENAIINFLNSKGFEVHTGREAASGEHTDTGIHDLIKSCDFGVVVYNEMRHNISYEWGLLDALCQKVFLLKDTSKHIDLNEISDKIGVTYTSFCGEDSEEKIIERLKEDKGLVKAIQNAVGRSISESPERPEVKEAAKIVVKSDVPLGTVTTEPRKILAAADVDNVITALSNIPQLTAEGYFYRGNAYYSIMEYDRAIKDYNKVIELNPNFARAYDNRGSAYTEKCEYDRAINDLNKGIELNPNNAMAYNNLGLTYDQKGNHDRAIEAYSKGIELNPNNHEFYTNRGAAYVEKKDDDRAINDLNKAIELDPNDAFAYNNRGVAHDHKKDYDRAIKDYNKAIELNPNFADAYFNRADLYAETGKFEDGLNDIKKAIEIDSKDPDYYVAYYEIHARKGDYDKASDVLRDAIKSHKISSNDLCRNLNKCLKTESRWEGENEIIQRIIKEFCSHST